MPAEQRSGREATGPRVPPLISATELSLSLPSVRGVCRRPWPRARASGSRARACLHPAPAGHVSRWALLQAPGSGRGVLTPGTGFRPWDPFFGEANCPRNPEQAEHSHPRSRRGTAGLAQVGVQEDPLRPGPAPGGGHPPCPATLSPPEPPDARAGAAACERGQAFKAQASGAPLPEPPARRGKRDPPAAPGTGRGTDGTRAPPQRGRAEPGATLCRPAPRPRAGGEERKAEPWSVAGTAPGTAWRALPPGALGRPGTRARRGRLPGPPARGANETVPAPSRRPPRQHRAAGRRGPAGPTRPVRSAPPALNGAGSPPEHNPHISRSGAGVRGRGERCKPAAGAREPAGQRGAAPAHGARPALGCHSSIPGTEERSEIKRYGKKERHFIGDFTILDSTIKVLVHSRKVGPKTVLCHSIYQLT